MKTKVQKFMEKIRVIGLIALLILISGCFGQKEYFILTVKYIPESELAPVLEEPHLNVTTLNLSTYPTLAQLLTQTVSDIQANSSSEYRNWSSISKEEYTLIRSEILSVYQNNVICYYQYYFSLHWGVS